MCQTWGQEIMKTTQGGNFTVHLEDMFKDTKNPKKHQERFKRKLLGDKLYYERHNLECESKKLKK